MIENKHSIFVLLLCPFKNEFIPFVDFGDPGSQSTCNTNFCFDNKNGREDGINFTVYLPRSAQVGPLK